MDPAKTVVLQVLHNRTCGNVELTFDEWQETRIDIAFRDHLYGNSGVIRFDGRTGGCVVDPLRPYSGILTDPDQFNQYFGAVLGAFANSYTFGWSPQPQQMVVYDAGYHELNNYLHGDANEVAIKSVQAKIIGELADPRKCVIAGCSNGELVRQCRASGLNAYGFDVIPGIENIAFPEVRGYLKHGSLTHIPYEANDGFDTLIAIDVLEHIPERDISAMVEEWVRLGVRQVVLLINLNQFWFPGHITMRPLWWWGEQWKLHFEHVTTVGCFPHLPFVYSNAGHYNQAWTLWRRTI
jgi:hypothetical protein